MAKNVYLNNGATDWALDASWNDGVGGATTVPVDTDAVFITEGSANVTGNVAGQTAIDLGACNVTRGFSGNIGGPTAPLTIAVNTTSPTTFNYGPGAGLLYLVAGTSGIVTFKSTGAGHAYLNGGAFTNIHVFSGQVTINDQVDLSSSTVHVYGGTVSIDYKADGTPPTIIQWGGTVVLRRRPTAYTLHDGTFIFELVKTVTAAATITQNGGKFDLRAGNITTYNANAGTYTAANVVRNLTIATTNVAATRAEALQGRAALVTYTSVVPSGASDSWPD